MVQVFLRSLFSTIFTLLVAIGLVHSLAAQVMSSGSYQIESDSINVGGGYSSSTNYQSESTVGEMATGESSSDSFALQAGFQQMQGSYISLTGVASVELSPSIGGVVGGVANASNTLTVVTDNAAGYSLTFESQSAPTLQSGADSIADYTPIAAADISFIFGSDDAVFGISPTGVDVLPKFLDDSSLCGSGTSKPATCWIGSSTTAQELVRATNSNQPTGATTTIYYRVGIGGGVNQTPGSYTGTTTITALPL